MTRSITASHVPPPPSATCYVWWVSVKLFLQVLSSPGRLSRNPLQWRLNFLKDILSNVYPAFSYKLVLLLYNKFRIQSSSIDLECNQFGFLDMIDKCIDGNTDLAARVNCWGMATDTCVWYSDIARKAFWSAHIKPKYHILL